MAKLATKLTGRRVGMWLPDPAREAFDEFMHGKAPMDDVFKRMSKQAEETETHLARIAASPAIDLILSQNKITPADLKKLHRLLIHSNLSDIAWEILSSPDDLRKLIEFHKGGVHPRDIHTQFRQRKLGTGDKNERLQQNER